MANYLGRNNWDPSSPESWAQTLGLVYVPMFSGERSDHHQGNHSVLLDGLKGSFALSTHADELIFDQVPLEWSWSSNMRHTVFVTEKKVVVKRWDSPDSVISKPLPSSPAGAFELLSEIEAARTNRLPDVISRMLKAFRAIRTAIAPYSGGAVEAIRVFNALLLGSEQARLGKLDLDQWSRCDTIAQAITLSDAFHSDELSVNIGNLPVGALLDFFINPDPNTNYILEPDLLIRHAAGQLYQEAHFEIEREAIRQPTLPGIADDTLYKGVNKRDARFTPPSLARTIVQQAIKALTNSNTLPQSLSILDPACGSGIFLQEAIRELLSQQYRGKVALHGFDTSEISCVITKFCLDRAAEDAKQFGIDVSIHIEQRDALIGNWGKHDFIFMNPPFLNWQRMTPQERDATTAILKDLAYRHTDIAMAFLWQSVQSLTRNGLLGSILPNPLLSSDSATKLREAILHEMNLVLIGSFKGYNYFPGAMVEPAFIVMRSQSSHSTEQTVKMLTAQEGTEDLSLRLLRRGYEELSPASGVEILHEPVINIDAAKWSPKTRDQVELLRKFSECNLPQVKDLFTVRRGIIAGQKDAFVLSTQALNELPIEERKFFRPLAGTKTIIAGRIIAGQYVFYPYNNTGLILTLEKLVKEAAPQYYNSYLLPYKEKLISRSGINVDEWWRLASERTWQRTRLPKMVSKYFGDAGSFAYDDNGQYIIGQGFAWLWRTSNLYDQNKDIITDTANRDEISIDFYDTDLPWAYVALLNSQPFRQLLSLNCPRVSGGQFDLSIRYVNNIYLPDLSDNNQVSGQVVEQLSQFGRMIGQGTLVGAQLLSETVANAYGIPLSEWSLK